MPEQLWNEMKIADRFKEPRNFAELRVRADLFQMGLRQTQFVLAVGLVGTIENLFVSFPDFFVPKERLTVSTDLLCHPNSITPRRSI